MSLDIRSRYKSLTSNFSFKPSIFLYNFSANPWGSCTKCKAEKLYFVGSDFSLFTFFLCAFLTFSKKRCRFLVFRLNLKSNKYVNSSDRIVFIFAKETLWAYSWTCHFHQQGCNRSTSNQILGGQRGKYVIIDLPRGHINDSSFWKHFNWETPSST